MKYTLWILFCFPFAIGWSEGKLNQFEQEATQARPSAPKKVSAPESRSTRFSDARDSDSFWEGAFVLGGVLLIAGGAQAEVVAAEREDWTPIVPVARVDVGYQWAGEGVSAWDVGAAAGRGLIAVSGRHTVFREEGVADDLRFSQAHVVYRMAILSQVELGLGFGAAWLAGEDRESGFSFALPFRWWPVEWGGLELRPAWTWFNSVRLSDIETSVVLRVRGVTVQAGYRWLEIEGDRGDLNGFRVGVGVRY